MKWPALLRARWHAISRREQRWVLVALALLLGAALWWVGLAPALATLRAAPQQHRLLDAQLQQMQHLQQQANTLQAQPRLSLSQAQALLEASVQTLGPATQLVMTGERATLTLKDVPANALASWLEQVRLGARAVPREARLLRNAAGHWDGTLVLTLSAR